MEEKMSVEELNEQLKAIKCDYDIASENLKAEICKVKDVFESSLLQFLPGDMVIRHSTIDTDWIDGNWAWQWRCEIIRSGFEFHSSFDFYFREGNGIAINNGCIGTHDKTEVGYIAAIKTMANIWNHVDEIEALLGQVSFEKLSELKEIKYKVEIDKDHIEAQIKKIQEEEFKAKLFTVGTTIALQEKRADRLFGTPVYVNPSHGDMQGYCRATVLRITPKKVMFNVQYGPFADCKYTDTVCIKKDKIIQAVKDSSWKIIENN